MRHIQFFLIYFALILIMIGLSMNLFQLIHQHPHLISLFLLQCTHLISGYLFLGMGFGFPLAILASILGWGQLLLLLNGNIPPHLSKKGFLNVIQILFNKI